MSQNKTIVPDFNYDSLGNSDPTSFNEMYSPSGNNSADEGHTFVPGNSLADQQPTGNVPGNDYSSGSMQRDNRAVELQNRVVVGVLFSNSKGPFGEIFPVYLGRNIIGTTENCDICLREATVSSEHAILYVRNNGQGTFDITITDYNSDYGTAVNNSDARYDTLPVSENDVISIGEHYKLLLKIFNAEAAQIAEDPAFSSLDQQSAPSGPAAQPENRPMDNPSDFYSPTAGSDSSRTVIY